MQSRWAGQRDGEGQGEGRGGVGGNQQMDEGREAQDNSLRILGFELKEAQLCTAISHYDSLLDMVEGV